MNNTENDRTKYILGLIALVLVVGTGFSLAELRKDQQNKQSSTESIVSEVSRPASENKSDTPSTPAKDDTNNTNLDKKITEATPTANPGTSDPNAVNVLQQLNLSSIKNDVEIKVIDINRNFVNTTTGFTPAPGNKYIALGTTIHNKKDVDFSYNSAYFSLKDASGQNYRLSSLAYSVAGSLTSGTLPALATQNGALIFEVPQNSQDYTLLYDINFDGKNPLELKLY
jgi:cytoskeletal protein RodZ